MNSAKSNPLDTTNYFLNTNFLWVSSEGKCLHCDDKHYSSEGAMLLRLLFEPIFAEIGKVSQFQPTLED